ncbi:MAG: hypothetical protein V3W37_07710 [Candidatus Binatia bacterium]
MTEPKLTPAMRRVLERMTNGVVAFFVLGGGWYWGDIGLKLTDSDIRASERLNMRDHLRTQNCNYGFSFGNFLCGSIRRITPKGRKALERT